MAQALIAEHGGDVPADMEKLTALPGVGRKTANVVLGHALGVPGLPVDRHVLRVSNRIGIAEGDDPVKVEAQLCAALPKEKWTLASDVQILHGRRVCKPKPLCDVCSVREDCDYFRLVIGPAKAGPYEKLTKAGPRKQQTRAKKPQDDAAPVRKARR
jgi:endonuclease-3